MKATQDNAVWVSNNYKQVVHEDNWAKMSARDRVSKTPLVIEDASTTQATVLKPYDRPNSSTTYVLYNPTDGEVEHTVSATNTSATFTRQGDYINGQVAFSDLKEDRFYTLRVKRNSDNEVLYKDKLFVTNQTLDQINGDMYSINEGEYVEQQTSNNDYIVL